MRSHRKCIAALLAALCLLAGCGQLSVPVLDELTATAPPPATLPPAATAAPQALTVGGPLASGGAAAAALEAYGEAMGVACVFSAQTAGAGLALLPAAPQGEGWLDLSTEPLLAAAAERAGLDTAAPLYALPLGRSLYAYWADGALLTALLGEGCLVDMQNATWAEWSAFADAVQGWLAAPEAVDVTLNGQRYTLPAQKPAEAAALAGVFALPQAPDANWTGCAGAYTAPLLAADTRSAAALTGPLNGLCSAFLLELADAVPAGARSGGIAAQLAEGRALFGRASLADLAADDAALPARLVWLPFKGDYTESDLSTEEYNLTGLMDYPALAGAGWLAIPAGLDEPAQTAAVSAALWLYTSAVGESVLIDDLLLISPWDTADGTSEAGAAQVKQVEGGILPAPALSAAQSAALDAAWQALADLPEPAKATAQQRAAFREAALAVLAEEQ